MAKQTDQSKTKVTRREMLLALLGGAAVTACSGTRPRAAVNRPAASELIVCGADEVFILAVGMDDEPSPRKLWSWRAAGCPDIPEPLQRAFRSTDDCKPVEGGRKILVSSSSGAVALIDHETRRAPFHAEVVNAHSVEMIPGGRIAAAASVSPLSGGNRVIVFDLATGRELASDPLTSAHGLVWDEPRGMLWALGNNELRAYHVAGGLGAPTSLKIAFQTRLPDGDGHDLSPVPATPRLFISTGKRCWHFDRDTRQLVPHDVLGDTANVKSYSVHPMTGRIAYVQAEGKDWWAERVHFLQPAGLLHLPGQRLYKARWLPA